MTAPTIEALRRAYDEAYRKEAGYPLDGFAESPLGCTKEHDAGLKAVAEMALEGVKWDLHNGHKARHAFEVTAKRLDGVEAERDAARAEAQQARREKNQAEAEAAKLRNEREDAIAAALDGARIANGLRQERDAGIVEIAALRTRVAEAERVAVACNESAAANQLAAFADREEAKRLREALESIANDPEPHPGHQQEVAREALKGGSGQGGTYEETDYIRAWAQANQKSLPLTRDHYERAMAERPKVGGA